MNDLSHIADVVSADALELGLKFPRSQDIEHRLEFSSVEVFGLDDEIVALSLRRNEIYVFDLPGNLLGADGDIGFAASDGAGDRQMRLVFVVVSDDLAPIEIEHLQVLIERYPRPGPFLAIDHPNILASKVTPGMEVLRVTLRDVEAQHPIGDVRDRATDTGKQRANVVDVVFVARTVPQVSGRDADLVVIDGNLSIVCGRPD